MSDRGERRARMRWLTLTELVAVATVLISGTGLWISYQDRRDARAEKAAEAARSGTPAPLTLKATPSRSGAELTLTPADASEVIQSQTIRFPPSFKLAPVTTTSDARIEADWFASALKADRRRRQLPEESPGDERLPILIETEFVAGGSPHVARAYYDVGYTLEGHFLRGSEVKLHGLSLIAHAPGGAAAAESRLAALWDARAGRPKS